MNVSEIDSRGFMIVQDGLNTFVLKVQQSHVVIALRYLGLEQGRQISLTAPSKAKCRLIWRGRMRWSLAMV